MKRYYSILLLVSLITPFVATYIWLEYEKYQVKQSIKWQMIEGMNKEELTLIKLTKEESRRELVWEHSGEFEYKGQMYDVVEKTQKGDTIYYCCWWDNEETKLNRQLSELATRAMGQNPQNKQSRDQLQNFLKNLYHLDINAGFNFPFPGNEICILYTFSHIAFYSIPPTPPPE